MFDLIVRANGGRSFCFQNAAFSIQTTSAPPSPSGITDRLQLDLMAPQGALLCVLSIFLWFYSQLPVAMLIHLNF
jgi:hypothetical protein